MDKVINKITPMLFGEDLKKELSHFPYIDRNDVVTKSATERLIMLNDLYSFYYPTKYSVEIYTKTYLALVRALQKKQSKLVVPQQYNNYFALRRQKELNGIIGGADSFAVLGPSGCGKTSAINRVSEAISQNKTIETETPKTSIIPVMLVQTPYNCSIKSLLNEILRNIDNELNTTYYRFAIRKNLSIDSLIGQVSNICLNHLGVLILDEIQNCVHVSKGDYLIRCLTQLINCSGISIILSGTSEAIYFFEKQFQMARRMLSLLIKPFECDNEFFGFCKKIWEYQYTLNYTEFSIEYCEWLYNHSDGNPSVIISLFHDAQELSIISGEEAISIKKLEEAFQNRLASLNGFISPKKVKMSKSSTAAETFKIEPFTGQIEHNLIKQAVEESKGDEKTLFNLLCKLKITIEEVKIC